MTRVAVFVDYQNVYMRAREAFTSETADHVAGQIDPLRLGLLLTDRGRKVDAARRLEVVRVFRGTPSPKHSPVGHAACQRQLNAWQAEDHVEVVTRPLRYYRDGFRGGEAHYSAREKGIDVLIALSIVLGAVRDEYDTGILCSADTDLIPAIEEARRLGKHFEVATWAPDDGNASRLSLPGMWCHYLRRRDYEFVADRADYRPRRL